MLRRGMLNQRLLLAVALVFSSPACSLVNALQNDSPLHDIAAVISDSPRHRVGHHYHQTPPSCSIIDSHSLTVLFEGATSLACFHVAHVGGMLCVKSSKGQDSCGYQLLCPMVISVHGYTMSFIPWSTFATGPVKCSILIGT